MLWPFTILFIHCKKVPDHGEICTWKACDSVLFHHAFSLPLKDLMCAQKEKQEAVELEMNSSSKCSALERRLLCKVDNSYKCTSDDS